MVFVAGSAIVIAASYWLFFSNSSPRVIADYGSGPSGRVVDLRGSPIDGAVVTVTFDRTVYDAITPVRRARVVTHADGRFDATFISCGRPGGGYTLTAAKDGFTAARIRGFGVASYRIALTPTSKAESR